MSRFTPFVLWLGSTTALTVIVLLLQPEKQSLLFDVLTQKYLILIFGTVAGMLTVNQFTPNLRRRAPNSLHKITPMITLFLAGMASVVLLIGLTTGYGKQVMEVMSGKPMLFLYGAMIGGIVMNQVWLHMYRHQRRTAQFLKKWGYLRKDFDESTLPN